MTNKKPEPYPRLPGTVHANVTLPETIHEKMKALRRIRRRLTLSDVKLSALYREATEQYLAAPPQQKLLTERKAAARRDVAEVADVAR